MGNHRSIRLAITLALAITFTWINQCLSQDDEVNCTVGDVTYPYPGDCTRYWECANGDAYLYVCPGGLWWNQAVGQCDYPGDFCNNSTSTASPTGGPTNGPDPMCPAVGEAYFPDPDDCTKYFTCYDGIKYPNSCPDGLYWHNAIGECDYYGDFCGQITDATTVVTPDPMCVGTSGEIIYYPYPGDCTRYYECAEGIKFEQNCPEGLWWHQEISQCDYPGDFCTES